MCWGEACGAGVGSGDHPALPELGLLASRRRFTEDWEWNEWGVQTLAEIRRGGAGPSPWPDSQRPLLPKGTSGASGLTVPRLRRPPRSWACWTQTAKDRAAGWVAISRSGQPGSVAHVGRLVRSIS